MPTANGDALTARADRAHNAVRRRLLRHADLLGQLKAGERSCASGSAWAVALSGKRINPATGQPWQRGWSITDLNVSEWEAA